MEVIKFCMKLLVTFLIFISISAGQSSNTRYGAGLDIGSKGSGFFFNYLMGNLEKSLDVVCEVRYYVQNSQSASNDLGTGSD